VNLADEGALMGVEARLRFGGYGTRRPPRKHELTVGDFARLIAI
jgi:hypothetical protein